jgi:hypothetical protein
MIITQNDQDIYTNTTKKDAEAKLGVKLSKPSKMPCLSYSIPPDLCQKGCKIKKCDKSVCSGCYANKGRAAFPKVINSRKARYEALWTPNWSSYMARMIPQKDTYFRWHEAGDIQDLQHLLNIVKVAELRPHVAMWLPTLEWEKVREFRVLHGREPNNLTVRVSSPRINKLVSLKDFNNFAVVLDSTYVPSHYTYNQTTEVSKNMFGENTQVCPAYWKKDTKCGNCRACWNQDVKVVVYKKH